MNNPLKSNHPKLKIAGIFLASAILIGVVTLMILKYTNMPRFTDQSNTPPSTPTEVTPASALAKLESGDKEGGLADLETALAAAKKRNDTTMVTYLEQQIDYANNSNFSKPNTAPPIAEPSNPNDPGRVTR